MTEKRVQYKSDARLDLTPDQRFPNPPSSPSRQKMNIVFVTDLVTPSVTLCHREAVSECVRSLCQEIEANFVLVQYWDLNSGVSSALDSFYDADAAIVDITIEDQRNSLYYHLGVRESFSMKQNILIVSSVLDSDSDATLSTHSNKKSISRNSLSQLSYEEASAIKSTLPNYALFVYSFMPKETSTIQGPCERQDYHCYVDQQFIDLSYSPGSDEQMDPSIPDFSDMLLENTQQEANQSAIAQTLSAPTPIRSRPHPVGDAPTSISNDENSFLDLKGQLKEAFKNLKWQAKVHMKEKFLADLKKSRELYQGPELCLVLHKFRRRLEDPNMLNTEILDQMLVSFKEVQDYDSMVELIDDLKKFPNLIKITSSPQVTFHYAFALNRRRNAGDSDRALQLITNALEIEEHQIPDSICLCGRIFKERFIASSYEDRDSLRHAIDWYRKAFKKALSEYAAINLATLLYIAGHDFNSSDELRHVGLVLNNLIGKKGPVHTLENYWDVATYFEFCLLAHQFAKAIKAAECMFRLKPSKWNLKSTIGNIELIYKFQRKPNINSEPNSHQTDGSTIQQEIIQSPEEQIVEFWTDFFIDAALDSCENQIRFAAIVLEQDQVFMPTYITMNLDAEEKSITISQMCITHLRDLNGCRKPHLWHIQATGIRGISCYKRDERCVFLYVNDNSDDFQIFFPSEAIRARFKSLVLSITGDKSIDISENPQEPERKINFVYELDKENQRIVLGRGSKGVVYAAKDVDTQMQIAIKEVPVKNIGEVQPLHEEIRLHSMLRHRNIVQYLGSSHEGNFFRIVMERVPGGSLSQLLQQEWGPLRGQENVMAYYSRQILDGLQYLHRQKIVHRDIKGDNVLVNTYAGTLKISDFGTCKRLAAINPNTETFAGTVPFMAPELIHRGQRGYSMPADIWSFGCTVVEMASGKPPFIEMTSGAQVMFRVGFHKEHPEIPAELSEKCRRFILRCFEPDTEHRATCDELLMDPFLESARPYSSSSSKSLRDSQSQCRSSSSTPTSPAIETTHNPFKLLPNRIERRRHGSSSSSSQAPSESTENGHDSSYHQPKGGASQLLLEPTNELIEDDELGGDEIDDDEGDDNLSDEGDDITLIQEQIDNAAESPPKRRSSVEAGRLNHGTKIAHEQQVSTSLARSIRNALEPEVAVQRLIASNEQLANENRQLWGKLYQVQQELHELLKSHLADKVLQVETVKNLSSSKSNVNGNDKNTPSGIT